MGFDLYGLNPINEMNMDKPIFPADWSKLSEVERDEYSKNMNMYEKAVPGDYWRSNVWWWRTLWSYTCEVCEDVMTMSHIDAGSYNDGVKIPKTTASRMVIKLKKAEKKGYHKKYEQDHKQWMEELPKEDCYCCDGTGIRNDKIGKEARIQDPNYTCNGCQGEGKKQNFMASYPFSWKVAIQFRKFIEQSGGFQIC